MRRSFFALAAVVAVVLSGCTAETAPQSGATPSGATPSPSASAYPDIIAEALRVLGPSPTSTPYTPEQEVAARVASADESWAGLLTRYPEAKRPDVTFSRYAEDSELWRDHMACLSKLDVPTTPAYDANGNIQGFDLHPRAGDEMRQEVALWSCQTMFPTRPAPRPSPEQLGYIYDFLTQFYVPCVEAHGIPQEIPPSRADFVAQWPHQGWFPTPYRNQALDDVGIEAVDAACPMLK